MNNRKCLVISIAPLLKQQSPARHFGHGWIELPSGKCWNPAPRQAAFGSARAPAKRKLFLKRLFS
ncbi:MAG: phage filamentation protein Fil family protein [Ewingella sp.]